MCVCVLRKSKSDWERNRVVIELCVCACVSQREEWSKSVCVCDADSLTELICGRCPPVCYHQCPNGRCQSPHMPKGPHIFPLSQMTCTHKHAHAFWHQVEREGYVQIAHTCTGGCILTLFSVSVAVISLTGKHLYILCFFCSLHLVESVLKRSVQEIGSS